MGSCCWISTYLDISMLSASCPHGVASGDTPNSALPIRTGADVAQELGGRFLIRYIRAVDIVAVKDRSGRETYVSPTAYAPEDTVAYLRLPATSEPRDYVVMLDVRQIPQIQGPRFIEGAQGLEYILPMGYGEDAMVEPKWPMPIS